MAQVGMNTVTSFSRDFRAAASTSGKMSTQKTDPRPSSSQLRSVPLLASGRRFHLSSAGRRRAGATWRADTIPPIACAPVRFAARGYSEPGAVSKAADAGSCRPPKDWPQGMHPARAGGCVRALSQLVRSWPLFPFFLDNGHRNHDDVLCHQHNSMMSYERPPNQGASFFGYSWTPPRICPRAR